MRIVACVETSWDPDIPSNNDPKDSLRRALSDVGIVSQFLNGARLKPLPGASDDEEPDGDHAVAGAIRDLFRAAGVFDHRLAAATAMPKTVPLDQPATLVGIHVRRHTPRRRLAYWLRGSCSSNRVGYGQRLVAIATDTTAALHGTDAQKSVGANEGWGAAAAIRAAGLRAVPPQSLR
jgi:MID domain of pPIWI_RE